MGDKEDEPPGEIVIIDVNATVMIFFLFRHLNHLVEILNKYKIILNCILQELDLNFSRIRELTAAELEKLNCLQHLYLRWNLIKKIENLQTLVTLRELELYGNQITAIEGLESLVNLEYEYC